MEFPLSYNGVTIYAHIRLFMMVVNLVASKGGGG